MFVTFLCETSPTAPTVIVRRRLKMKLYCHPAEFDINLYRPSFFSDMFARF